MLHRMFTVYDDAAAAYLQPFFCPTVAVALRSFTEVSNQKDHVFFKYAHQYTLFQLGEFDDTTAIFQFLPTPVALCKASEVKSHGVPLAANGAGPGLVVGSAEHA